MTVRPCTRSGRQQHRASDGDTFELPTLENANNRRSRHSSKTTILIIAKGVFTIYSATAVKQIRWCLQAMSGSESVRARIILPLRHVQIALILFTYFQVTNQLLQTSWGTKQGVQNSLC